MFCCELWRMVNFSKHYLGANERNDTGAIVLCPKYSKDSNHSRHISLLSGYSNDRPYSLHSGPIEEHISYHTSLAMTGGRWLGLITVIQCVAPDLAPRIIGLSYVQLGPTLGLFLVKTNLRSTDPSSAQAPNEHNLRKSDQCTSSRQLVRLLIAIEPD